eukprot:6992813-Prymnesium_polylepis.1
MKDVVVRCSYWQLWEHERTGQSCAARWRVRSQPIGQQCTDARLIRTQLEAVNAHSAHLPDVAQKGMHLLEHRAASGLGQALARLDWPHARRYKWP